MMRRLSVVLVSLAVLGAACGGGSDSPVFAPGSDRAERVGVNDASIRVVEIGVGRKEAPGTRLVVSLGAIDDVTRLVVSARPARSEAWEASEQEMAAFTKLAMEDEPGIALHPIRTPLAIAISGRPIGPEFVLEPDGTEFAVPVLLEIPADLIVVAEDETVIALLSSGDGSVEVVTDVERGPDVVTVPLSHFSAVKLLKIPVNALGILLTGIDKEAIDHAAQLVGPNALTAGAEVVAVQCARTNRVVFDESLMPGYFDLLNNLARLKGSLANVSFYEESELEEWLQDIRDQGLASVSVAEIYDKALEISDQDAFQALVIAHEVLRNDRLNESFKNLVTDVRGDGHDELGARYHLFGTAIYSFWYEYRLEHPDVGNNSVVVSPEMAAAYEEALVSGDIDSGADAGDYIVDLAGSKMGRDLYRVIAASGSADDAGNAHPCASPSGSSSTTTTIAVPESSSSTSTIVQAEEPFPWTYEGTYRTHSIYRLDFGAADSIENDNELRVTITLFADGTVGGALAAARLTGVGPDCSTDPPPGTLWTYEADSEERQITGSHSDGTIRFVFFPGQLDVEGEYTAARLHAQFERGQERTGCSDFPDAGTLYVRATGSFDLDRISPPAP